MELLSNRKKIDAAIIILQNPRIDKASFDAVRTLIQGINPRIDSVLFECSRHLTTLIKLQKGELVILAGENLPDDTPERKKRKKTLLVFLGFWKELKGEVVRVQKEMDNNKSQGNTTTSKLTTLGNILSVLKGPLGIITVAAIGVVILKSQLVSITIKNTGCQPLNLSYFPVSIPGIKFPKKPIISGSEDELTVPPIAVTVDGRLFPRVKLNALGINLGYDLTGFDISFDNQSIKGVTTTFKLGGQKNHELLVRCF